MESNFTFFKLFSYIFFPTKSPKLAALEGQRLLAGWQWAPNGSRMGRNGQFWAGRAKNSTFRLRKVKNGGKQGLGSVKMGQCGLRNPKTAPKWPWDPGGRVWRCEIGGNLPDFHSSSPKSDIFHTFCLGFTQIPSVLPQNLPLNLPIHHFGILFGEVFQLMLIFTPFCHFLGTFGLFSLLRSPHTYGSGFSPKFEVFHWVFTHYCAFWGALSLLAMNLGKDLDKNTSKSPFFTPKSAPAVLVSLGPRGAPTRPRSPFWVGKWYFRAQLGNFTCTTSLWGNIWA